MNYNIFKNMSISQRYILIFIAFFAIMYYFTISECNKESTFLVAGRFNRHRISCNYKYQYLFVWALILLIYLHFSL